MGRRNGKVTGSLKFGGGGGRAGAGGVRLRASEEREPKLDVADGVALPDGDVVVVDVVVMVVEVEQDRRRGEVASHRSQIVFGVGLGHLAVDLAVANLLLLQTTRGHWSHRKAQRLSLQLW